MPADQANVAARILEDSFYTLIGRGLCGGPQTGMNKFPKAAQPRFSPISGPFWVRVGVRVRVRVRAGIGLGGGLGLHPYIYPTPGSAFCSQTRTAHRPREPGGQLLGELIDVVRSLQR